MDSAKFEVGKKYKSSHSGSLYECLWAGGDHVLMKQLDKKTPEVWHKDNRVHYFEYKEPEIIERFFVLGSGFGWSTLQKARGVFPNRSFAHVILEDGQPISVEIVK